MSLSLIYGSFLNHASRVSSLRYVPSTDDILRARLQTVGVEEHRLVLETGTACSVSFLLFANSL